MKKIFICASVVTGTVILSFTANAQKMNTAASPKAPEATANKLLPVQESKMPVVSSMDQEDLHKTAVKKSSDSAVRPKKGNEGDQTVTKVPAPEAKEPLKTSTITRARPL